MELYRGVVSHKRWPSPGAPAAHGFAYELFLVLLDVDDAAAATRGLWPFAAANAPALASFYEADHMKGDLRTHVGQSLGDAVRGAVTARVPGWTPPPRGRTLLLTHLRVFGYCFNPISIYYILDAAGAVDCIVAEVSNTPWNEMHVYVLHARAPGVAASREARRGGSPLLATGPPLPLSSIALAALGERGGVLPTDFDALARRFEAGSRSTARRGSVSASPVRAQARASPSPARSRGKSSPRLVAKATARDAAGATSSAATALVGAGAHDMLRFTWAKDFHVSPFYGMDHTYDWRFSQPPKLTDGDGTLLVQSRNLKDGACVFSVQLMLDRVLPTRARLCYLLLFAFPFLTFRIQWWIHVEAFRLFGKGAQLFPHPTGAQNAFTRTVEALVSVYIAAVACCSRNKASP